ncbi:hypothetical protein L1889_15810 [Paenalcaligenes niemegkensis]|uniref:hypothetical protein n=1 Tax=Paenalcaligenes niemegkensis TaxID=2895469 RepID=UPI001EE8AB0C|nr:hypothetical protein [Paenalcaligenes niemegkensis]MCQ9617952.1 hypothetical protein [Paenalcaligenes niemegkensis]
MTWPSCQESRPVFVLLNRVGFGAIFAGFLLLAWQRFLLLGTYPPAWRASKR